MEEIRINRIVWISQNHPSLTEIFDTYPKYLDNIELVSSKLLNFIVYKYYKYINIYFQINEDFKSVYTNVQHDQLLIKWLAIENGLFKLGKCSKSNYVADLIRKFNDKLNSDGQYL